MILSILQVFYAFFSGVLQALSISNPIFPLGSPFIALFALVPMYIAFYSARSYRKAFLIFFIEALTTHLFSSSWLANFHGYAVFTLGASALGTAVLGGLVGIVTHFFPAQLQKVSMLEENGGRKANFISERILWFCASWILWEWIKSTGQMAYPWGTISMAAYRWKIFTQITDITGVWGVTFLYTFFGATLTEGIRLLASIKKSQNPAPLVYTFKYCTKSVFILFGLCGIYGLYQYFAPRVQTKYLSTVIVQQNADPWGTRESESIRISAQLTEQKVNEMQERGKKPDLILWSEGTLNKFFPRSIDFYGQFPEDESLTDFINRMDTPFIIGGAALMDHYKRKLTNVSILFDRDGNYAGFYSKMHLVPFAELIPMADNPFMSWFIKEVVGLPATLSQGKQTVIFKIPLTNDGVKGFEAPLEYNIPPKAVIALNKDGLYDSEATERFISNPELNPDAFISFSTPICFEDAFPDVCRKLYAEGSEVFLNITNDSWSKNASAEYQHFIAASYLAIEFRTTLVRCCNSGFSVVVEPNGKIKGSMPLFCQDAMEIDVPVYERKFTTFAIYGDWFAYTIIAFMVLYFLVETIRQHFSIRLPKIRLYMPESGCMDQGDGHQKTDTPANDSVLPRKLDSLYVSGTSRPSTYSYSSLLHQPVAAQQKDSPDGGTKKSETEKISSEKKARTVGRVPSEAKDSTVKPARKTRTVNTEKKAGAKDLEKSEKATKKGTTARTLKTSKTEKEEKVSTKVKAKTPKTVKAKETVSATKKSPAATAKAKKTPKVEEKNKTVVSSAKKSGTAKTSASKKQTEKTPAAKGKK